MGNGQWAMVGNGARHPTHLAAHAVSKKERKGGGREWEERKQAGRQPWNVSSVVPLLIERKTH